jgi:hypothetical protein
MADDARSRDAVEIVTASLLAAATVASAWCAYQSALWSGDQTRQLATANSQHFESVEKASDADVAVIVDVTTFINVLESEARGDRKTADYLSAHARPDFRPTLEHWIEERRAGREPADLPFHPPDYRLAPREAAKELEKKADQATQTANVANSYSDLFVLHTVLFAMAMFFLGSSSAARSRGVRRAMMIIGALVLVLAVISMASLPRAPSAPSRADLRAARKAG